MFTEICKKGESITEVTVGEWLKKEGDTVKIDDVLCTLDSDKASFELPAEADGVLHIMAQAGDTLPIGAVICTIDGGGSTGVASPPPAAKAETPAPAPEPQQAAPLMQPVAEPAVVATAAPVTPPSGQSDGSAGGLVEMKVPAVGESITEVTIAAWSKKDGDVVALDEVLCELESDKATFELPAEAAGTLRIVAQAGETLPIGGVIARIEVGQASTSTGAPAPTAQPASPTPQTQNGSDQSGYAANHASPAAAKILDEKGVQATAVQGTGIGGRITKEDAMNVQAPAQQAAPVQTPAPAATAPAKPAAAPAPSAPAAQPGGRGQRREKMTSLRKTIARRLVAVKNETAMLTTFNEVDMKP
ncbi:MAG: dihydrolipoamide succinyltransferase, partial [Bacteroidetes bacterium]